MRKKIFFAFLFLFFMQGVMAQSGPSYVLSDTTISAPCDFWVVDPDSLRGNNAVGTTTMVVTTTAGSRIGFQLDSSRLQEDADYIAIYDGPSTSYPLLSTITRSQVTSSSLKSSGPVITIVFQAYGAGTSTSSSGWRLKISCLQDIQQTAEFLPVYQGLRNGNVALNDYDKDGDKDVLMGGVLYRNDSRYDSTYAFDRVTNPLGNWRNSNMASADFDGDGLKDVFITGETDASGLFKAAAMIFKNANGVFSPAPSTFFTPAILGAVSVLDFNADGRPDIAYSGYAAGLYVFKLYLNTGNLNFVEKTVDLPGLLAASMSWKDFDNDGDLDLLYNGSTNNTEIPNGLFINNDNNSFTRSTLILNATHSGDIKWVDVNKDGKYDIVNSGYRNLFGAITPEIFFNGGDGSFTRVVTNLPPRAFCHHDWADYDNDGDMDVIFTGSQSNTSTILEDAAIYRNEGNGVFSKKTLGFVLSLSNVQWVDVNNDSKWDVFVPGRNLSPSYLFKNMGADSFMISSYPFAGYQAGGTALVEDFTSDGVVDVLFAGNLTDQNCEEGNRSLLIKSVGWQVAPIAVLTRVADLNQGLTWNAATVNEVYWRWGDVNSDGKDDILATGDPAVFNPSDSLRIFKNDGNDRFPLLYQGYLPGGHYQGQVGVIDVNNDGINELYGVPNNLYSWNGTGFTAIYSELDGYCSTEGCTRAFFDIADYDGDGFQDVAYSASGSVYVLKNNKNGKLERINGGYNIGINDKFLRWIDFDSDGDPDLLTSNGIFENTSYGGLRIRNAGIPRYGQTGIVDLNDDGFPDIFALQYTTSIGPAKLYYNLQGKFFFEDKTPEGFIYLNNGVYFEGADAFDIDNDGDNDLIYSTRNVCTFSGLYLNKSNYKTTNLAVTTPNGGENFQIGTTQTIQWAGSGISTSVRIELSLDSGLTWSVLATEAPSSKSGGSYSWTTSGVAASGKCLIRITDANNTDLTDKSNRIFALSVATAVDNVSQADHALVYPNPVNHSLFLSPAGRLAGRKATFKLYNASGGLLIQGNFIVQTVPKQINMNGLPDGMYFIQIAIGNIYETHKVIKQ